MSIDLLSWAMSLPIKNGNAKVTLMAICDQISDHPDHLFFYGSQAWLAKRSGVKERQIRNHLAWLEDYGVIRREKRAAYDGKRMTDAIYVQRQFIASALDGPAAIDGQNQRQSIAYNTLEETLDPTNTGAKKPERVSKAKRKTSLPENFPDTAGLDEAMAHWEGIGRDDLSTDGEAFAFQDHCRANGKTFVDWRAAWRTWYRRAEKFNRAPPQNSDSRQGWMREADEAQAGVGRFFDGDQG